MRITIVSGFRPGYDVGLESSYARAYRELGHDVATVPELPNGDLRWPRGLNQIEELKLSTQRQAGLQAEVAETRPELVLIVKGRGVFAESVARWKRDGARVINVFPDNPFEAASVGIVGRKILDQLRATDLVLVHDRFAVGQLRRLGIASDFIAFARDPLIHSWSPTEPRSETPHSIVFIGNPDAERIRYLRAVCDLGLAVYGTWSWAKLSSDDPLLRCVQGEVQLGAAMVQRMRSAKLSINVLRQSQKTAHNMRTFEIPACGVCCLSESTIGVEELFDAGREIVTFASPEQLRRQTQELLRDPDRIEAIAAAGWQRVQGETYTLRAQEILSHLR